MVMVEVKDLPQDLTEGQGFAPATPALAPMMSNMPQQYVAAPPPDGPPSVDLPDKTALVWQVLLLLEGYRYLHKYKNMRKVVRMH